MKKILAIAIAAIMTVALCISASAAYSLDRLFVNVNDREQGDAQFGTAAPDGSDLTINKGDKLYIIGWAIQPGTTLDKIVYTIDAGEDVVCNGTYRDRPDAGLAFGDESLGIGAGFGADDPNDGGMLELAGISELAGGTYDIAIRAVYKDGTEDLFDNGIFRLIVVDPNAPETETETEAETEPETETAVITETEEVTETEAESVTEENTADVTTEADVTTTGNGGLQPGAIVGIIIAAVVVVAAIVVAVVLSKKKK